MLNGECTKCIEGFMVLGGTCEVCQGGVCSCSDYDTYYVMYSMERWMLVGMGVLLGLLVLF